MPRTKEQIEAIRKEKESQIKKSAFELFAKHGYETTSVSRIAKHAKISKGLLYNYFESKEELLHTIMMDEFDVVLIPLQELHEKPLNREILEAYLRRVFRHIRSNVEFYRLFYSLTFQPNVLKLFLEKSAELKGKLMGAFYLYFKERFKDPDTEIMLFSSFVEGMSIQLVWMPEGFTDEIIESMVLRILEMFGKDPIEIK